MLLLAFEVRNNSYFTHGRIMRMCNIATIDDYSYQKNGYIKL